MNNCRDLPTRLLSMFELASTNSTPTGSAHQTVHVAKKMNVVTTVMDSTIIHCSLFFFLRLS